MRIFECYVHSLFFGNFLWYVLISSDIHARGTKVPLHIFIQWEDREIGVSFPDSIGFIRPDSIIVVVMFFASGFEKRLSVPYGIDEIVIVFSVGTEEAGTEIYMAAGEVDRGNFRCITL